MAVVHLPDGASKDEIKAWGHGPLQGNVSIADAETVIFEIDDLSPQTFVEGRVVFPPRLVSLAPSESSRRLPMILAEEKRWVEQANYKRRLVRAGNVLAVLLPISSLAWAFTVWLLYGREYKVDFQGEYYREPPQNYPPAVLGYLWRFGKVEMNDLVATIMDLARRGFIKISEVTQVNQGFLGNKTDYNYYLKKIKDPDDTLSSFEINLMDYFFNDIGIEGTVSSEQLKSHAQTAPAGFKRFINDWKKLAIKESETFNMVERASLQLVVINIIVGLFISVFGIILIAGGIIAGFVSTFLGILQALLSGVLKRRTREGALQYRQWTAFRRFLLHFSNLKEAIPTSMAIWEHYLVYAVSLGVAKEVIRQLKIVMPRVSEESAYIGPPWFATDRGIESFSGLESLNSFFSDMISTATSSMSSSGGGGFSGGGGDGGGGGDAG